MQSFQQYIEEKKTLTRETIDQVFEGYGLRFDSELGYIIGNVLRSDGIEGCSTITTVQKKSGARTSFVYAGRKPRINTYGDSYTQGNQVSDAETWQEYLAGHLGEPIRNFGIGGYGVYQAYRRMIRVESSDHGAQYLIFYPWGEDHLRSLYRCRFLLGCNVEMDLQTGQFIERENPLATAESIYQMTDPHWMVNQLIDDHALALSAYVSGDVSELPRPQISALAEALNSPFDWDADSIHATVRGHYARKLTPLQAQAENLLDRYSLDATEFVLAKVRKFAQANNKELLVVLFDPFKALPQMVEGRPRYEQQIVDYLTREGFKYFDMNQVHLRDFQKYRLSWSDYIKEYIIGELGHYNPRGNHYFAYSIKDSIKNWLTPRPVTYKPIEARLDFQSFLNDA